MIKGIFCHDLPVYKDKNGVYCSTTMTDDLFRRYFHVVDQLIVAARVYPLATTYEEAHQEKITLPNVRFIEFPNLNRPQYLFTLLPRAQRQLIEEMRDIDLIFIRGGILALLGVKAAKKLGKPYLVEAAGCAWDEYWNHSFYGKMIAPYMELQSRKNIRNAAFVIYVTEKWLQNRYPTNGRCTYASNVILKEIDEEALSRRIKKIEHRDKNAVWVLGTAAGVNNKAKGQQFVIEAIAKLRKKYKIRYELVGTGDTSYLKSVAKRYNVEDCVIFKGELTHAEVLKWMDDIDTYIQPSMQEGLPRALIEAMSRACPAIGSTTAGIPELLETSCIFKRGNGVHLTELLQRFAQSDWLQHGKVNFYKAKEYQIHHLDARRNEIYQQYCRFVIAKGTKE